MKAKKLTTLILALTLLFTAMATSVYAVDGDEGELPEAAVELYGKLDRGLVAAVTSNGVFVNWRFFKEEATGADETGLTGTNFNLYRNGELIAYVTNSTNYMDAAGKAGDEYFVRAVNNGVETDQSKTVTPLAQTYLNIAVSRPPSTTVPTNASGGTSTQSYSMGDMSVGDVDGDGVLEVFVIWNTGMPDVIGEGYYAGPIIDCYKIDGTILWRVDLGVNIRPGAHYTQMMVGDYNGDGKVELMVKTAPGTKYYSAVNGVLPAEPTYITMKAEDIAAGYTHNDDYRTNDGLNGVALEDGKLFNWFVDFFMNWESHPEVVNGNWAEKPHILLGLYPGGQMSSVISSYPEFEYPLSREQAISMTNLLYAQSRVKNGNVSLASQPGYVYTGPEYLTVFNGETGAEMDTIDFPVPRDDVGIMWGDLVTKAEPLNRVDRFNSAVAYLDGEDGNPTAIFNRGYYTRTTYSAINWDGESLNVRWIFDTGYPVYPNPFSGAAHQVPGRLEEDPDNSVTTQGFHALPIADVDGDGKDEIVNGGAVIDDDGTVLYSSYFIVPEGANKDLRKRLGHGDSIHVTDIDPDRPGLEIWTCHEERANTAYGELLRSAATGEAIFGDFFDGDNGRAMIGDFNYSVRGIETYTRARSGGRYGMNSATGVKLSGSLPSTNGKAYWFADLSTGAVTGTGSLQKGSATGALSNMTVASGVAVTGKDTPGLVVDFFGDYREEMIFAASNQSAIRIYFNSSEVSTHKLFTFLHDRQYRVQVVGQLSCYNQPSYPSFYYATDMDFEVLARSIGIDFKDELRALVDEVNGLATDLYTTASLAGLAAPLAAAEEVLALEGAERADIDAAYDTLLAAVEALVLKKPEGSPDANVKEEEKYTRAVDGGYTMISFKLYDADKIVGFQLNDGAYNALTPNKNSDINYIKVGGSLKGAVYGLNVLKVFDALGNVSIYEFVLVEA